MNTESQAIDLNRKILKSSLTRQFTRSPTRSRKRIISLPPNQNNEILATTKRVQEKYLFYLSVLQGLICLTIRELNGLCLNTCRYTKAKEEKKYFLNNKYFDSCFNAMNKRKFQLFNK
ncbi:unnamed protein product (macronuclear) [Paramecium tetraurelia]|uniref:Uncharacterized protein n=1 Tax=Paramecium tetraurelia TaxID=5888 RepID=A0BFU5_PARTE|nr:uncharacterized protein GSPATT00028447001 [Paramecium tetraurelia]CAK57412.1 unnamed protein product [Paramecium tetraurelia]|eukprot:XP_001424810.1 hypothetical protein (macronuclear) [Paramecium tetraurelia strain d4-2]